MQLAYNGKNISSIWWHDPNIKNKFGHTVEYYLKFKGKDVPNEWKTY